MVHDQLVAEVIRTAGGEVVGRIRLQKIVYLLDQKGLKADAAFHYYHYGPYSRILDMAVEKAKVFRGVQEEIRYRSSDGAPFSVFTVRLNGTEEKHLGAIDIADAKKLLLKMTPYTSTVLELAATIHWLAFHENLKDWRAELDRRKGAKTKSGRAEQAITLLNELGLSPV